MADMLTPLEWDTGSGSPIAPRAVAGDDATLAMPLDAAPPAFAATEFSDKLSHAAFCWPTPPYVSYPVATPQTDPLPCEIVGRNAKKMSGRLTFFVPEEGVAHVQLPPARTTLPLRFDQFQSLSLTTPLRPVMLAQGSDPHARLLGHRAHSIYSLTLAGGQEVEGET
ncbi:MAG: hypothetical protein ABUL50_11350, partial [Rhizobacter sp.]